MTSLISREIRLEIAHNVRHIGGYGLADGGETRDDLIRAGSLKDLTPRGVEQLATAGVKTIVDLRSTEELTTQPTPDVSGAAIRVVHAPVFEMDASPIGLGKENKEFEGFAAAYPRFLDAGVAGYRLMFETMAESEGRVLFHCSAGKDRTGVAAGLLLELAGVSEAEIVADYAQTEELLRPMVAEMMPKMLEHGLDEATGRWLLGAKAPDMEATLADIRTRWGGAEGYLTEVLGLSTETISAVRARVR